MRSSAIVTPCFLTCLAAIAAFRAPAATAQTLSVSSSSALPGTQTAVDIGIMIPETGQTLSSLEWTFTFPSRALRILADGPVLNPVLQKAGKSLTCRGSWQKASTTYSYHCLLAGGVAPLENGTVASARLEVRRNTRQGPLALELDGVKGVSAQAKAIRISGVGGTITVLAPTP